MVTIVDPHIKEMILFCIKKLPREQLLRKGCYRRTFDADVLCAMSISMLGSAVGLVDSTLKSLVSRNENDLRLVLKRVFANGQPSLEESRVPRNGCSLDISEVIILDEMVCQPDLEADTANTVLEGKASSNSKPYGLGPEMTFGPEAFSCHLLSSFGLFL
ncbi:hypothetical protein HPP92_029043 [Vanilla planifolia]|uniref:Uncharacterized protein n=1 Tax=Vanilla planifolia TaxID=51239 RepID=A0A835P545_VANPL|nr:hypothetical protein HPP92_029043 [Vanilla planifolia]KAG0446036.1 hypothetical protein HPP92_029032 [Vanilla planifolia]